MSLARPYMDMQQPTPLENSGQDEELSPLGLVKKRYDDFKDTRPLKQWWTNLSFYIGEQWATWDDSSGSMITPKAPSWRIRMTDNQLQPLVRKEVAKLTKANLIWQVFGATGEESDVNAAKMCQKVIEATWRNLAMDNKRTKAVLWAMLTGTSLIKTWFDIDKGPMMASYDGEYPSGDINSMVVSPFEFITDPTFEDVSSAWWCLYVSQQPVDRVNELWANELQGVKVTPDSKSDTGNMWQTRVLNTVFDRADVAKEKSDTVTVKEYWERPSANYPKGRLIIVAGETVLVDTDNPTPEGDLPFADIRHIAVPGRFWGTSALEAGIPHQKYINMCLSQIQEIQRRTARPAMLVPNGSAVGEITSQPGGLIKYNPVYGLKPEWQAAPPVPVYMLNLLDRAMQSLFNIFGQHEVSMGQVPAGVRSGTGVRFLQEQDDTMLGPTAHSLATGFSRWGKQVLGIFKQDVEDGRKIKYVGKNKTVEVLDFNASNITGSEDIEVIPGSLLPESKAARQDFLVQLYQMGAFVDTTTGKPDNQRFFKMLEIGSFEELFDDVQLDMDAAELETRALSRGEYTTIHNWDNHQTHMWKHNAYRKTVEFMQMPPDIKANFNRHIALHQAAMQPGAVPWFPDGSADEESFLMMAQMEAQQGALEPSNPMGGMNGPPDPNGPPQQPPMEQPPPSETPMG